MLGKSLRSIRHLYRISENKFAYIITKTKYNDMQISLIYKYKNHKVFGNSLVIFNNEYSYNLYGWSKLISDSNFTDEEICMISSLFHKSILIEDGNTNNDLYNTLYDEIILLPNNFNKLYENVILSNKKLANELASNYGSNLVNNSFLKVLFAICNGSKNYFQWAINLCKDYEIRAHILTSIMNWADAYPQLVKELSKSGITAYKKTNELKSLIDEMRELRSEKRINDTINSFNTAQKKILKEMKLTDKDKKIISNFYRLSPTKKKNFIRKMSTICDGREIIHQMGFMTNMFFSWDKDSLIEYLKNVEGLNYKIIFDKGDIVLIKVDDFETIKKLGKTTNWCISKNKQYWDNYMERGEGSSQYMLFDFSKNEDDLASIVGFTVKKDKGITNAHNFINEDIMLSSKNEAESKNINSYVNYLCLKSSIFSILDKIGFDVKSILEYTEKPYKWNKKSVLARIKKSIDKNSFSIIKDENDLMVMSVKSEELGKFFGNVYYNNVPDEWWGLKHLLFFNFSKSIYSPERMMIAIIGNNFYENEEVCNTVLNANYMVIPTNNFEYLISEYGLPYDVIRRVDDEFTIMERDFTLFDAKSLDSKFENKSLVRETINEYLGTENLCGILIDSITKYVSFDLINLFYKHNYKISDFIGVSLTSSIIYEVMNVIDECGSSLYRNKQFLLPNEQDIEMFYNKQLNSLYKAKYIGSYIALTLILKKELSEPCNLDLLREISYNVMHKLVKSNRKGEIYDSLVLMLISSTKQINNRELFVKYYEKLCVTDELKEKMEKLGFVAPKDGNTKQNKLGSDLTTQVYTVFDENFERELRNFIIANRE